MIIERTNKEIIIRLSANVKIDDIQAFINYARYLEITSQFNIEQNEVDKLANEINDSWWTENKDQYIK